MAPAVELTIVLESARDLIAASTRAGLYGDPKKALSQIDRRLEIIKAGAAPDVSELKVHLRQPATCKKSV